MCTGGIKMRPRERYYRWQSMESEIEAYQIVQQICEVLRLNCGFDDKSMTFCTQLGYPTRKICGHRAIAYLSHGVDVVAILPNDGQNLLFSPISCSVSTMVGAKHILVDICMICYWHVMHRPHMDLNTILYGGLYRDAINVFLSCHVCHIWHICLVTHVGPTRADILCIS